MRNKRTMMHKNSLSFKPSVGAPGCHPPFSQASVATYMASFSPHLNRGRPDLLHPSGFQDNVRTTHHSADKFAV